MRAHPPYLSRSRSWEALKGVVGDASPNRALFVAATADYLYGDLDDEGLGQCLSQMAVESANAEDVTYAVWGGALWGVWVSELSDSAPWERMSRALAVGGTCDPHALLFAARAWRVHDQTLQAAAQKLRGGHFDRAAAPRQMSPIEILGAALSGEREALIAQMGLDGCAQLCDRLAADGDVAHARALWVALFLSSPPPSYRQMTARDSDLAVWRAALAVTRPENLNPAWLWAFKDEVVQAARDGERAALAEIFEPAPVVPTPPRLRRHIPSLPAPLQAALALEEAGEDLGRVAMSDYFRVKPYIERVEGGRNLLGGLLALYVLLFPLDEEATDVEVRAILGDEKCYEVREFLELVTVKSARYLFNTQRFDFNPRGLLKMLAFYIAERRPDDERLQAVAQELLAIPEFAATLARLNPRLHDRLHARQSFASLDPLLF